MSESPLERFREVCNEDPAGEKILLVPTYVVGQRLTDALARSGTPWIGIRTVTLDALAHDRAAASMVRSGSSLLSRAQALAMIETACDDVLSDSDYFGRLRHSTGFFRAIQRSIDDLRASRIRSASFPVRAIPNEKKSREIRRILARYETLLDENRFVDRAELYDLAIRSTPESKRVSRLFSAGLSDLSPIQLELIDALAVRHVPLQETPESLNLPKADYRIVAARGAENEIRAVLRTAVARQIPLDSIEIVHTSREPSVPVILEVLAEAGASATFEEGIPVPYTRPGQAILGFFDWIRRDWDATVLRKLISSGVIGTGDVGPVHAARLFRNASVGWGRDRHLSRMDALVREHESKVERRPEDERAERSLQYVKKVRHLVRGLIDCTPGTGNKVRMSQLARLAHRFVSRYPRIASPADAAAREALLRVLDEVQTLPDRNETPAAGAARLDELVRDISVLSESPRPGAVHISPLETGAWGAASHLFVVGLDESFPGGGLQDPVLLDEERSLVNRRDERADLPLSSSRPDRTLRSMRAMLDRASAVSIDFSYSNENVLDERESPPSPFLLDLWRIVHEEPEASYEEMTKALAPGQERFVARHPSSAQEAWIALAQELMTPRGLSTAERKRVLDAMSCSWPWLGRGLHAEQQRQQKEITPWSGKISAPPEELDPRMSGHPVSSSRLERFAESPFRYFLERLLKVRPLEELQRRPEEWLEAREFGTLFHEMLYDFMTLVTGRGETPDRNRHMDELKRIALDALEKKKRDIPAPSDAAFDMRKRELLEACELFLTEETAWCRTSTPRWFEVSFGRDVPAGTFGSPDPVNVDLGEGGVVRVVGQIDRIDECGSGRFKVWDYKSGSTYGFEDHEYLSSGKKIQHALYSIATRELLRRAGISGDVEESGYYFPTRKGRARRITRIPPFDGEQQEALRSVLTGLLDTMHYGSFIHAIDDADCTFCDFKAVCGGDIDGVARRAKEMSKASADPGVVAYARARGVE